MTQARNLTYELADGVFLIDLPQSHPNFPGFHHFISAWYFKDALGRRIVVDPGPASTIPLLNRELEKLTDDVDLILLTHIHMDHAGGVGQFTQRWPNARYILHSRGFKHLRNPEKLWHASLKTLGSVAEMYAEPLVLDESVLMSDFDLYNSDLNENVIEVFETPGHAPHHVSLRVKAASGQKLFFIGESAGITCPTLDHSLWVRPATPTRFDPDSEMATLDLLESILTDDDLICFAHWGVLDHKATNVSPKDLVKIARQQLQNWTEIIASMHDTPVPDIVTYLMKHDSLIQSPLDDDLRERERIFMANSVTGILKALIPQK